MSGATGWLLRTLAGGGLLLLLAWAWAAWTRQPARRLRVAEWAAGASLLLATLSLGPAWLVVTTPAPGAAPAAPSHSPEPPPDRPDPAPLAATLPSTPPAAMIPAVPAAPPAPAEPAPHVEASAPAARPADPLPAAPRQLSWRWSADRTASAAVLIYIAVGGVVLGRWLLGWVALWRLTRSGEPVTGRAAELFREMAGARPLRFLASGRARAPFSCGLLRPTVVLPAGLCENASDEALRWVFAHELAHLERRDAWSGLLFSLAQAVYYPLPWFWRLRRQARLCQEYLADAAAAAAGGRPEDYAQFLLAWTAAPRAPVGACGVWGRSSDLFWRVKTMLQNPTPLERRCPRRWSLAAACGLLSLAVVAAGVTLKAAAAPAPDPKDEPKKEQPKDAPKADQPAPPPAVPDLPLPNVDDLLKSLPNLDADQARSMRKQMEQMREQMRRMMEMHQRNGFALPNLPANPFGPFGQSPDGRLGATVEKPSDALVEQLELPKEQGLVLHDIMPDSAAAKAGLKANDILLEVDGKPVSSDPEEFRKALDNVKPDKPVDVVVLRKGKKETVKGLSLPEAKAAAPGFPNFPNNGPINVVPLPLQPPVPNFPNIGNVPGFGIIGQANGGNGVITTTYRTNDHFTTRHQEGSLIITLTGKVEGDKATVGEISVQDGAESNKYESVDKVPEKYRDKVKNLVEMSEKGSVKVEIKGR